MSFGSAALAVAMIFGTSAGSRASGRHMSVTMEKPIVFSPQWIVAMASLVPLICLLSVLLGVVVSSRVGDPRTAQQFGAFVVLPIIAIAVAQFMGGQATFTMTQVLVGDLVVMGMIGALLVIGSWAFNREEILTRLG